MNVQRNILIIDDSQDDSYFLERLVLEIDDSECEYKAYMAANYEQAEHIYQTVAIDCALIDYFMLDYNGVEIMKILQEMPSKINTGVKLPVALISGGWSRIEPNALNGLQDVTCIGKDEINSSNDIKAHIESLLNSECDPITKPVVYKR